LNAAQVDSATTATPLEICTTSRTPLTAMARLASNEPSESPCTGGRTTVANSIPGARASIPNFAAPVTLMGVSTSGTRVPTSLNVFGSLSRGCEGTGSAAAASARSP
jgi:hypothetical protein